MIFAIGRMPGWTPAVDPVGPWGPVALESIERLDLESIEAHATVKGETPHLSIDARIAALDGARIEEARVRIDGRPHVPELLPENVSVPVLSAAL